MSDGIDDIDEKKRNPDELVVFNLMRTEPGRAWIWKQLQSMGVFETIFNKDTITHAYNAGKREAGLGIVNDLKTFSLDYYIQMMKENI